MKEEKHFEIKKIIEAALFLAGKHLSIEELSKFARREDSLKIKGALDEIKKDYVKRGSPIELIEEEGRFKLDIKPEYLDLVKPLAPQMDMRKAVLTTLSYIAFKQPITQAKLVKLFGNRIYEYDKELIQRGLINAVPHKRTRMLTTSKKLSHYLGGKELEQIKKIQFANIEQTLKQEIAKEETFEKKKQSDELKQLEKKKELTLEEWERLLEKRRVVEQQRLERKAKRARLKKQKEQNS